VTAITSISRQAVVIWSPAEEGSSYLSIFSSITLHKPESSTIIIGDGELDR
jgi:hypothetical protein